MPSLCPLQCRHQWPAFVSHDYSVTVGIHEADKHGQTPDLLLYKNPNMLWTLTAAWGRLLKWNELVRLVRVDKKKKQIWESNIKWDSPIYRATAARGTKRHVDKNIRDIGGEAERDREGGRGRDMEGWQRDREGERGRDMEGGDAGEQSNSCWASHLLQVESSANRQTGTDPLRQAPGRERDGQRKSGTQRKAVGGGVEARLRGDEMRRIQLKRRRVEEDEKCMEAERAPATCYSLRKWSRWSRVGRLGGWFQRGQESPITCCPLFLPTPSLLTPPLTSFLHLSLAPSFSSVRLTEQEKPVRVKMKGLWGRCVRWGCVCEMNEWPLLSLIPLWSCPALTQ